MALWKRIALGLGRWLSEAGRMQWEVMSGTYVHLLREPDDPPPALAEPPPGHPESWSRRPPTEEERLLWQSLGHRID
ncbi:MAG TPA: DUF6059 family protein [Thermomonospora sp.]|nr:DUF6059 family protein [Thermomonospora sp.]